MIVALLLTLAADIEVIAKRIDSVVGVAAKNLATGETVNVRAGERFPMGSVYKLAIGVEALHQADEGRIDLQGSVTIREFSPGYSPIRDRAEGRPVTMTLRALLEAMVRDSDNTACDELLVEAARGKNPPPLPPTAMKRLKEIEAGKGSRTG